MTTPNADSVLPRRWFCRVEWKPQDCWLGVFWRNKSPLALDVWVCLLPTLPIHFGWQAVIYHDAPPAELGRDCQCPPLNPDCQHPTCPRWSALAADLARRLYALAHTASSGIQIDRSGAQS